MYTTLYTDPSFVTRAECPRKVRELILIVVLINHTNYNYNISASLAATPVKLQRQFSSNMS